MTHAVAIKMGQGQTEGLASHQYFEPEHGKKAMKLLPNEYFATAEDLLLSTVLGSCVAACVRDPVAGVGGMNHFMLPMAGEDVRGSAMTSLRYGVNAMRVLLESLYAMGARRERLEAKVFGGGMVLGDMMASGIGEANSNFVLEYLQAHEIRVLARDLKDRYPRRVHYFPLTGVALVKRLKRQDSVLAERDKALAKTLACERRPIAPEVLKPLTQLTQRHESLGAKT